MGESLSPAIEVDRLSRSYETTVGIFHRQRRHIVALESISFSITPGELFGLVGPNGAGKTSLIKILSTLLLPSSGKAYVLGMDVARQERKIRACINTVFGGDRGLYTRLSGEDNLKYFSDLYRIPRSVAAQRIPRLLEQVNLTGREKERVEGYSRGMKQRLHIAKALVNDPEILFLDEPTIGLDPNAARNLHTIIQQLQAMGKTILLTSHYMHEVDLLCKRVAVINKGQLITIDTPHHLKRYVAGVFVVEARSPHEHLEETLINEIKQLGGVENALLLNVGQHQNLVVQTTLPDLTTSFLKERLQLDQGAVITREPTLEDAYMKLVGTEA